MPKVPTNQKQKSIFSTQVPTKEQQLPHNITIKNSFAEKAV